MLLDQRSDVVRWLVTLYSLACMDHLCWCCICSWTKWCSYIQTYSGIIQLPSYSDLHCSLNLTVTFSPDLQELTFGSASSLLHKTIGSANPLQPNNHYSSHERWNCGNFNILQLIWVYVEVTLTLGCMMWLGNLQMKHKPIVQYICPSHRQCS